MGRRRRRMWWTWSLPARSRPTSQPGPRSQTPFKVSATFQMKFSQFANDASLWKRRSDSPGAIWWQNRGVRCPVPQSHGAVPPWLPCQRWSFCSVCYSIVPHRGLGLGYGTDFDFIFNELIHEIKVLSLTVNSRACLLLVILLLL